MEESVRTDFFREAEVIEESVNHVFFKPRDDKDATLQAAPDLRFAKLILSQLFHVLRYAANYGMLEYATSQPTIPCSTLRCELWNVGICFVSANYSMFFTSFRTMECWGA